MFLMNGAAKTGLSKTATKREAARLQREINARQKQLTSLRGRRPDGSFGSEGYGFGEDGQPTVCQRLVDEMAALGTQRRALLGEEV